MIDRVIICGVRRGNSLLPESEIKQGLGRAGRSYIRSGYAFIVVPEQDESYAWKCFNEDSPPVVSEMNSIDNVAFHVLPWIRNINTDDDFNNWYQKTLASVQGKKISWGEVKDFLEKKMCLKDEEITEFGKISVRMYFSPSRIFTMSERIKEAYLNQNLDKIAVISWVLANEHIQLGDVNASELNDYKNLVKNYGYYFDGGELLHGYIYFCLLSNTRPKWLKYALNNESNDIGRLMTSCMLIADALNIPMKETFEKMLICATKKVSMEVADVIREFNIEKKAIALELMELGISNEEDLKNRIDYIESYGSNALKDFLEEKHYLKNKDIENFRRKIEND